MNEPEIDETDDETRDARRPHVIDVAAAMLIGVVTLCLCAYLIARTVVTIATVNGWGEP